MSAPEAHLNGWTLMPKFDFEPHASHSIGAPHGEGLLTPCAVCRKPHGGRLVRSVVVSPIAPKAEKVGGEPRIDSRYYPPAVPVLSRRSSGPINRTARWSLAVA
ncbi:MAG TPA: hypothetical protein VGS23_04405 [Thermoplasmata archaeon]|nr:hypothetical protein [Thermoplasmata archaeon]